MRPKQGMEPCQKRIQDQRKRQQLHSTHPRKTGYFRLREQKSRRKEIPVESGACEHIVSKRDLTREEATEKVKELFLVVTVMLLEETPAVLFLGKLCEDHGYAYHWTSGQKPHLTKNGKRIDCKKSNYVPFVIPGLSTSSSTTPTPTSSSSSSQHSVFDVSRYTENPVPERSGKYE